MLDNIQIYCDLDGVLVEFEQSAVDLMNLDLNAEAGYNTADVSDDILDFTERNPFGEIDE